MDHLHRRCARTSHVIVGLACALRFALAAPDSIDAWPRFRGPGGTGISQGQPLPIHFGPTSNLLWKVELPPGHSSPVVWNGKIVLTAASARQLSTICLEASSGSKTWEKSVTVEKLEPIHKANSHASPTAVADGNALWVYFPSFGLLAYGWDGTELWRKPLPLPKTFFNQGSGTSPVLADGKLIVFVQVGQDSHLLALNPADGAELWKAPMPQFNNSYSTPVTWREADKSMVGLLCAGRFTAFSLAEGKETWWVDGLGFQACSTPVVDGERVVMTAAGAQGELSNMTPPPTFDEVAQKYDRDNDQRIALEEIPEDLLFTDRQTATGSGNMPLRRALAMFGGVKPGDKLDRTRWETIRSRIMGFRNGDMNRTTALCVRIGGQGDVTTSRVLWKETRGVPEVPSPLVWQGRVYLIRSGGLLVCRNLEDGQLIYEERVGSPGGYFASPVLAGGRLYLASDRGTVTVVQAADTFEVLARNEFDEPIIASPAVAKHTIYVRSAKHLWAIGDGK